MFLKDVLQLNYAFTNDYKRLQTILNESNYLRTEYN